MPAETFTQSVIRGLQLNGYSIKSISGLIGVSISTITAMRRGDREITNDEAFALEDKVGLSAGQIACAAIEPDGGKFSEMIDGLAETTRQIVRSSKRAKAPAKA